MSMSQTQYLIVANRLCKTHKKGSKIVFTGSIRDKPYGWTNLGRVHQTIYGNDFDVLGET